MQEGDSSWCASLNIKMLIINYVCMPPDGLRIYLELQGKQEAGWAEMGDEIQHVPLVTDAFLPPQTPNSSL